MNPAEKTILGTQPGRIQKPFFDAGGLEQLGAFLTKRTLLAFDYDGTLAGLHPHPDDAILTDRSFSLLGDLCAKSPVAILTGRSIADVSKFLPQNISRIVGNHGLEGVPAWDDALTRAKSVVAKWRPQIHRELGRWPGVLFEDKDFTVTLHAQEGTLEHAALLHLAATLHPASRVILGKGVLNVVPADAPHKGSALRELLRSEGFDRAFFAGDDVTDEDVFEVDDPAIFSVLVGPRTGSSAKWRINPQERFVELLEFLIGRA